MLIAFYKPFGVLSQFTPDGSGNRPLSAFGFPKKVYPTGRMEGIIGTGTEARVGLALRHCAKNVTAEKRAGGKPDPDRPLTGHIGNLWLLRIDGNIGTDRHRTSRLPEPGENLFPFQCP